MKLYYLLPLFFIPVARALIVTLHELGHAIPAMLFTKKKVEVFIGTSSHSEKDAYFKIGLLELSVNYKVMWLKNGFCRASMKDMSVKQQLIYLICGPVFPVLISILLSIFPPTFESETSLELYGTFSKIFMFVTLLDAFMNLIPRSEPIDMGNGIKAYNDGENIRKLLESDETEKPDGEKDLENSDIALKLKLAMHLFKNNQYADSIVLLDELIENRAFLVPVYRFNIKVNLAAGDYEKAKRLDDKFTEEFQFHPEFQFNSNDYNSKGLICQKMGTADQLFECFDKAIELDPNNVFALNNKGYFLSTYDRYEEAIPFFDKVIELDKSISGIYSQRAVAKIKSGKADEGYLDIEEALKRDPDSAHSIKILGMYHLYKGEAVTALQLFLKAKELDFEIVEIDQLILEAEKMKQNDV